jgi:type VI secretion system secreted protein Hcp
MQRRLVVVMAVLSLALPLYAGDDPNGSNESAVVTFTFDAQAPEVISSASWGIDAEETRTDAGTVVGKRQHKPITIRKKLSKSSQSLFLYCAGGKHLTNAQITVRKAGGKQQEYIIIKMEDILITRYTVGSESDSPTETITLSSAKVDYQILASQ